MTFFIYFLSEARTEIKPFDRFWRVMAQNAQNRVRMCILGVKMFNFNIRPLFSPKNIKFCPKNCKNSNFKPKWWNMKVKVYQKLLNQWTWKFDTTLRTWNSGLRRNMMTSQQVQYGGRPPYLQSYFGYISTIFCLINAKFGTLTILFRHRSSDQINNFRKFKMADGRHFENGFITIYQPRIVRFQWNLVCRCKFRF